MSGNKSGRESLEDYRERETEADLRYRRSLAWFSLIVPLLVVGTLLIFLLYPVFAKWFNQ